ncbi:unnamed protein product [Rangifer tarandus platyrhynchus]|uniref:Uncharacterized protein n=1 Tax=Rangifer tarandus platyrhynchus TaxID=3082113 RepID=A0AC59YFD7_RANTA
MLALHRPSPEKLLAPSSPFALAAQRRAVGLSLRDLQLGVCVTSLPVSSGAPGPPLLLRPLPPRRAQVPGPPSQLLLLCPCAHCGEARVHLGHTEPHRQFPETGCGHAGPCGLSDGKTPTAMTTREP